MISRVSKILSRLKRMKVSITDRMKDSTTKLVLLIVMLIPISHLIVDFISFLSTFALTVILGALVLYISKERL